MSYNFVAAVTLLSDFWAQGKKICHCFHIFPICCHKLMGLDAMILVSWMLHFKPAFSLSSFTLIKRFLFPFCQSGRVVSSISEVLNISPSKVDSSLWFIQPVILHDVLCIDSMMAQQVKSLPAMWETWVQSLGWADPLEKKMSTTFLPGKSKEPDGLQSIGLQRVEHNWVTSLSLSFPLHRSKISRLTMHSLDIFLSQFWISQLFHVWF